MEDFGIQKEGNKRRMQIARHFNGGDTINLQKSLSNFIEKGKAAQEGEQREWNGKKFKKVGGKWVPVGEGREKKESPKVGGSKTSNKPQDKPASAPQTSGESSVDNHEIAQMTHMKKILESDPSKAYEIYQTLSPEAQQKVPQEVVNKLVENSHQAKDDPAGKVFEDKAPKKSTPAKKKKPSKPQHKFSTNVQSFRESVSRMRKVYDALNYASKHGTDEELKVLGHTKKSAQEKVANIEEYMKQATKHNTSMKGKWDDTDHDDKVKKALEALGC